MCIENLNAGHVSMCLQTSHADTWRHGLLKYKRRTSVGGIFITKVLF